MKKIARYALSLPLFLLGLVSCSTPGAKGEKSMMLFGTKEFDSAELTPESNMRKIEDVETLKKKIEGKDNFVLLAVGSSHWTCSCWQGFHTRNIVPFQKQYGFLFHYIDTSLLQGEKGLPFKFGDSYANLVIFKDGKVAYQQNDASEKSDFVSSYSYFRDWMLNRVTLPRVYYINKEQLSAKYDSAQEFTIYFSRLSCGDCQYLERGAYKQWYLDHPNNVEESYVIDMDAVGISKVVDPEGNIWTRTWDGSGNEYQQQAYAQYMKFKEDYGLSYDEEANPVGFSSGVVPTIYHINPDGHGTKKGDVIDMAGAFYNESWSGFDREAPTSTVTVSDSFFDEARLDLEALSYADEVETKNLVGLSFTVDPVADPDWRHTVLEPYETPLLNALLDHAVGQGF